MFATVFSKTALLTVINTRNKVRFRNEKHLKVYNYEFERVGEFKYIGSLTNRK